jgi:hypothetical protein
LKHTLKFIVKLGQVLGKGKFGSVYASTCPQLGDKQVAVKEQVIDLNSGLSMVRLRLAWYV